VVKKISQTLSIGKMQFIGRRMTGGWIRWYPVNEEAMVFLKSNNRLLPRCLRKDHVQEEVIKRLCEASGQSYLTRDERAKSA
jgi:hypothetical protein